MMCTMSTTSTQHCAEHPNRCKARGKKKEIKGMQIKKEKIKPFLFQDDCILPT